MLAAAVPVVELRERAPLRARSSEEIAMSIPSSGAALRGRRALVTGASSGLGADFARELARRGADLVLVARREAEMQTLAAELRDREGVAVEVVPFDLGATDAPERLHAELAARGLAIDVLVNNAGFGVFGDYLAIPWERERAMLQLDIVTLAGLTKVFGRAMAERGWGRILQVASIGAYQATPTYAAYSAAKSFVLLFGEAVDFELAPRGVRCTVVSPGVTATEFLQVAGQRPTLYQRAFMMQSPQVTRAAVRAMLAGRRSVVPGLGNALLAWSVRLIPRRVATWIAWLTMRAGHATAG